MLRRQVGPLPWNILCGELKGRFRQPASNGNIRRLMNHLFQGGGEPFDEYLQNILQLEDCLPTPLANYELLFVLRAGMSILFRKALFR